MQLQIFGECMILIINYQKIKEKIIGKKNAKTTQQVLIAKFTNGIYIQYIKKTLKRVFLMSWIYISFSKICNENLLGGLCILFPNNLVFDLLVVDN